MMKLIGYQSPKSSAGFTLLELLIVVAGISTVAAAGFFAVINVTAVAESTKLRSDVAVLNNAIRLYQVNGGTFLQADLESPTTVLAKLKRRVTTDSAKQLAGLRHSMTDHRLTFEMQSDEEARGDAERARFIADPRNPRFVIQRTGPPAIRRFVLDPKLAEQDFGTEHRAMSLNLAKSDPWVWDYDASTPAAARPAFTPTATVAVAPSIATAAANALPLNPPVYAIGGGNFPLLQFDLPLTLSNPNPLRTSSILYSINGGGFTPYTGQAIPVAPGMSVASFCVSTDPDNWEDSAAVSNDYAANIVPLELNLSVPQPAVTYADVGGAMLPGLVPQPARDTSPRLSITNLEQIPVSYQNSGSFSIQWTYDDTEPLTSSTAITGPEFSNGFNDQAVDISLARWANRTTLPVKAVAKSLKPAALHTSAGVSGMLTVNPIPLRPPVIAPDLANQVTIVPRTDYGDTPFGYRIFYTLDGTEPQHVNGVPVNGILYTGPFDTPPGFFISSDVKARVLGPEGYERWFTPSPATTLASASNGYAFLLDYHNAGLCGYTWNVLGTLSSVAGDQALVNGSIAVGPLAALHFNTLSYSGNVAKDPLGVVTGPASVVSANITPIRNAAMALNTAAGQLTPTQIFDEINSSTKIDASASDGMNIVMIRKINLSAFSTLTFRGGPADFFIVNVTESINVVGGALIKLSGGMRVDRVLINSPNGAEVKLTGGVGTMSMTFLAPKSEVTIGGSSTFTGSIFSGNLSGLNGNPQLLGGNPFGECDDCCD